MELRTRLLTGLAERLHAAGAGVYDPDGVVADPQTGIYLIRVPEAPLKIISLRTYDSDDDPKLSDMVMMVQARTRAGKAPLDVLRLSGLVYGALHGLERVWICEAEPLHLIQVYRESEADVGPDERGSWERTENYLVQLNSDLSRLE